jgi:hypothetical protein
MLLLLHPTSPLQETKVGVESTTQSTAACKRDNITYVILSIQTRNDVNLTNFISKHITISEHLQGEQKGKRRGNFKRCQVSIN